MRRHAKEIIVVFSLLLLTTAVYWQVRNHEFVNYSDDLYVSANTHVRSGLNPDSIRWAFTSTFAFWHPLTRLSRLLDSQLFGMNAGRHHLINLLFHLANTVLLFLALKSMTGAVWRCAFVAALFAVHPLNVETVAWVTERKGVLSTFFWILTMWAYGRYTNRPSGARYLFLVSFFVLGLMAKPMLVTLPFVLVLLDYWPLGRLRASIRERDGMRESPGIEKDRRGRIGLVRAVLEKTPLILAAAVAGLITVQAKMPIGEIASFQSIPLDARISNAVVSYARYLGKMFRPGNLAPFYPYPERWEVWQTAGAAVILLFVTLAVMRFRKTRPYLLVGWLWFIGTLVPVIGLMQVGSAAMADRYAYVSLIGLFVMAAWGIPDAIGGRRSSRALMVTGAGVVLFSLAVGSWVQAGRWKNSVTLFRHAIRVTERNHIAHNNLGNALDLQGMTEEAAHHYRKALEINPQFEIAHKNMGDLLARQGKMNGAMAHYDMALRLKPNYAEVHNNLGLALALQGRVEEAAHHYRKALDLKPDFEEAHYNLGILLLEKGRSAEAISHFGSALRIKPDYAEAHNNMGVALARQGRFDEAKGHFSTALQIRPGYVEAEKNLRLAMRKGSKDAKDPGKP